MVDRRLIELLDSREPEKRKSAIQQLARSKDMGAIRYLEAAERSDSDASVRDIARKAIAYIKKNNAAGAASAAEDSTPQSSRSRYAAGSIMAEYANQPPSDSLRYEEPMEPQEPVAAPVARPVNVPESRVKSAKSAVEMAMRANFDGENGRAARYLVEAFKLNPNLQFDAYAVGLAATVTGLYKTDAIAAVMDGSALELFDKKQLKGKKTSVDPSKEAEGTDVPPAGWGTALVDLLIYGLINAVIVGVTVIAFIQVIINAFQNDPTIQAQLQASQTTLAAVIEQVAGVAIVGLILYALAFGLMAIIFLLFQQFLIHVVARMVLGGDGTMSNLIHRTALFLGIMGALITVVQIGGFFLPVISDPALGIAIWALGFFLSIYTFIGYSSRIGQAYDMGGTKGCSALVMSSIVIVLLAIGCVVALVQANIIALNSLYVIVVTP